jgi:hypothetical protein
MRSSQPKPAGGAFGTIVVSGKPDDPDPEHRVSASPAAHFS